MPFLFNRNAINDVVSSHPEKARRLLVRQGHEKICEDLIDKARKQGIQYRILPADAFTKKCGTSRSHVCLECDDFIYTDQDDLLNKIRADRSHVPFLAIFDGVKDPHNLGNIVRTSVCLGVDAVIIPKDRSCMINETVVNVSRGAVEFIEIVRVTNLARYLDSLKKLGIFCYGLDEHADKALWETDLSGPVCLVMGGEEGLRRLTKEKCDDLVRIPTNPLFPSLNVATAYALASYEVMRSRH